MNAPDPTNASSDAAPAAAYCVHPGEILLSQFLEPRGITQYRLAKATGVPPRRINEIVLGKRGITADTALRLARYFGTAPELWMHLQMHYELDRYTLELGSALEAIEPLDPPSEKGAQGS